MRGTIMSEKCCNCNCAENRRAQFAELQPVLDKYAKVPGSLITILQKAQDIYGYLSVDTINYISEATGIKPAKIYGVATFYAQFRLQPIGKYLVMLCQGTACHVNGADMVLDAISTELGIGDGDTTDDGLFSIKCVACLGCCSLSPVMMINEETYGTLTPTKAVQILRDIKESEANGGAAQ